VHSQATPAHRRHIPALPLCVYRSREETAAHTLLFCQYAKEVWEEVKITSGIQLQRASFTEPKYWVFDFLSRSSDRQNTALAVVTWHLWITQNGVKNGEPMRHPHSVAEQCKAYIEMIELHLYKPDPSTSRETISMPRWSPPPEGMVKIHVDAALFPSSRRMGIGVVIRSHRGDCLLSCSELVQEVMTPEVAEALALRHAVSLAGDEGFDNVVIASDCLSLVQRINSSTVDRSQVGVLVQDIKARSSSFAAVSFIHVYRNCNEAAHTLARSAERFVSVIFRNCTPKCIRQTICNGFS
jgi:ribonuclease HI